MAVAEDAGALEREIGAFTFALGRNGNSLSHLGVDGVVVESFAFNINNHIRGATEELGITAVAIPIVLKEK